jgi:hypothetical protein
MLALLAMVFMGQSVASLALPCGTVDNHAGDAGQTMMSVDHAGHHMVDAPAEMQPGSACCDGFNYCSMASCLAAAALLPTSFTPLADGPVGTAPFAPVTAPVSSPESPFRPPISG